MAVIQLVDVIAPVKHGGRDLPRRLRSLLENGGSTLGRLLIVADAALFDSDAAWGELAGRDARCLLLRAEPDSSWVDLCNRGLSERRGDAVVLYPDARVFPGWLDSLAAVARSAERVALAAPLSEGDGLGAGPFEWEAFRKAVGGLPADSFLPRSGRACNYLRGDILDALGSLDPTFLSPRAALDDWLMRAREVGFFARRANHVLVSADGSSGIEDDWAARARDVDELKARHPRMADQVARFERSLDARLAAHAMEFQTTGKIKVALDLRHLPAEVNGTKIYARSLGRALAAMPEVELTLLAAHPLQADGIPGRVVQPGDWDGDAAVIHKPAQIFDRRHSKLLFGSSAHVVITYQDLIAYRMSSVFPSEADYAAYQESSGVTLPAAQAILSYSNNTVAEIEDEFGIPREDVHGVLLGVDVGEFAAPVGEAEQIRKRLGLPDRYFFSLASDFPHKNLAGLLEAYSRFRDARPQADCPALVLAGFASSVEAKLRSRREGGAAGARFLGGVSAEELRVLYQGAEAFVFPSLYEGFGLPPLEAMATECPVIAMPFSSVPEVCGDSVLYADGLSADDLARAMGRIADDEALRSELRERGRERIKDLRWRETARLTYEVYRKAVLSPSARSLQMRRSLGGAISHWADATGPFAASTPAPAAPNAGPAHPGPAQPTRTPEPEPMGVLNACKALRGALKRRVRRDLARVSGLGRLKRSRLTRLSRRFVQVARADGLRAASELALRKARGKSASAFAGWRAAWNAKVQPCRYFRPPATRKIHEAWQLVNSANPRRSRRIREAIEAIKRPATFSILVPVYNPPVECLAEVIESVLAQSFENWELILVDDASTDPRVQSYLSDRLPRDSRIRLIRRESNGHISAATNTAAEHARGEFIVLADHDDTLHPDALAHLAIHIEANPDVDLIYTDEDKVGDDGVCFDPQFKSDWSPELLLSFCYTVHLTAVRASLYRRVGGMRLGFEGSQDHDFWLRASELAREIGHIPQITYHWRVLPGSTAAGGNEKSYSFEAGRRAVEEAFARRGVPCRVMQPDWAIQAGGAIFEPIMPDQGPSVAILIPALNPGRRLETLLASLRKTTYRNYVVYLIINKNVDAKALAGFDPDSHKVLRVESSGEHPNLAAIRNRAVATVSEDLALFLDADMEVIDPRWLSQMVGWSRLPGVGSVGVKLLDPDLRTRDAGIAHGLNDGLFGQTFKSLPRWDLGVMALARATRNCLAVNPACMLTPRRLFTEMGGFDEARFPAAHGADYGYRLRDAGHRNVICGPVEMIQHEGSPRGVVNGPVEEANYRRTHGGRRDPYFSLHLETRTELFHAKPTVAPIGPKDRPIPVLAVSHNLNWEGAPRFELELITGLKELGAIEPTVVSPVDGPLRAEYEKAGISPIIEPSLESLFKNIGSYNEIRRKTVEWIAREGFEVVHANTLNGFWAVDAAEAAGAASIWSIHESEPWRTCFDSLPVEIARKALGAMSYPYRVVFAARCTAELWRELDTNRCFELIRYGLDAERFARKLDECSREEARARLGLAPDEVCVLSLGTVCERKGQHDLARAFGELDPQAAASTRCVVVGARDGLEYGHELRRLAEKLGQDRRGRFQIVGETGDTAPYWQAADVFCCSSRVESYPYVILEAMGRGLPIITTPVHGISEQVGPGFNALTYAPGDVETLRRHLEALIRDGSLRQRMAAASPRMLHALPSHGDKLRRYAELFRAAAESGSLVEEAGAAPAAGVWRRAAARVRGAARRPATLGALEVR